MIKDPYTVLGVSHVASEDEIKAAYRRLAKKYHPDLNPGNAEAARRMNEINAAYDQIKNPQSYSSAGAGNPYGSPYGNPYGSAYSGQNRGSQYNQTYYYSYDPYRGFYRSHAGNEQNEKHSQRYNYNTNQHWTVFRPGRFFLILFIFYLLFNLFSNIYRQRAYYYYPNNYGYYSYNSDNSGYRVYGESPYYGYSSDGTQYTPSYGSGGDNI